MTQETKNTMAMSETPEKNIANVFDHEPMLSFCQAFLKEHPHAQLFLVGGAVRDLLLGRKSKDFDFVVCGIAPEDLQTWFSQYGSIDLVGRSFGVFKFSPKEFPAPRHEPIDLALPRREHTQEGSLGGYRDFDVQADPSLPVEEDLSRRDFTINAMAYSVRDKRMVDPFGGQKDLEKKIICAVGNPEDRFKEDMSRALRALRQAAQLDFVIEPKTWDALCETLKRIHTKRLSAHTGQEEFVVAREVIAKEILKALLANPARAVDLLYHSGAFEQFFPEVHQAIKDEKIEMSWFAQTKDLTSTLALLFSTTSSTCVRKRLGDMKAESMDREASYRISVSDVADLVTRLQHVEEMDALPSLPAHEIFHSYAHARGFRFLSLAYILGHKERVAQVRHLLDTFCQSCRVERLEDIRAIVTGRDVMETLGIPAGPKVGEALRRAFDLQLTQGWDRETILSHLKSS
jgi:tRNA nucleotidyltransferase/poly(A) polymerase